MPSASPDRHPRPALLRVGLDRRQDFGRVIPLEMRQGGQHLEAFEYQFIVRRLTLEPAPPPQEYRQQMIAQGSPALLETFDAAPDIIVAPSPGPEEEGLDERRGFAVEAAQLGPHESMQFAPSFRAH
ncbi:hypothetical protein D3C72_1894990 [compost metagenome]